MTLGTPVLTSRTSSIPEIAGDAALMVDPYDPRAAIAKKYLQKAGFAIPDQDGGAAAHLWTEPENKDSSLSITHLELPLFGSIVTNIEVDHLDHYGSFDAIVAGFDRYLAQIAGPKVLCADDSRCVAPARAASTAETYARETVERAVKRTLERVTRWPSRVTKAAPCGRRARSAKAWAASTAT